MPGHDSRHRQQPSDDHAPLRAAVVAIATIAWGVATFLPVVVPRIPPVQELTPAFIAFLGCALGIPEIGRARRRGKDDEDQ